MKEREGKEERADWETERSTVWSAVVQKDVVFSQVVQLVIFQNVQIQIEADGVNQPGQKRPECDKNMIQASTQSF